MDICNILLFLPVSLVLLITPGPNVIYVITKGMIQGRKAAFKGVLGASAGDVVQALAACLGLTGVITDVGYGFFHYQSIRGSILVLSGDTVFY